MGSLPSFVEPIELVLSNRVVSNFGFVMNINFRTSPREVQHLNFLSRDFTVFFALIRHSTPPKKIRPPHDKDKVLRVAGTFKLSQQLSLPFSGMAE